MQLKFKAQIIDQVSFERTLVRISHQIIERNHGTDNLCLIGIRTRGVPLAQRIAANIEAIEGVRLPVGELDITLHRDDLTETPDAPIVSSTHIPFDITGKEFEHRLDEVHITVNKNSIPNDPQSPFVTSGIRVGTPAVTSRGFGAEAMKLIAKWMRMIAEDFEGNKDEVSAGVAELCAKFPIYNED